MQQTRNVHEMSVQSGAQTLMTEEGVPHMLWSQDDVKAVQMTHKPATGFIDRLAFGMVKMTSSMFDFMSGYSIAKRNNNISTSQWCSRLIMYETLSNASGATGAMMRHLRSLRLLHRDYGWVHTLVEDAENERMHLLTALQLKEAGSVYRLGIIMLQMMYVGGISMTYFMSPKLCHRMIAYSEEAAFNLYTNLLQDLDKGLLPQWQNKPAPEHAIKYYRLPADATLRDVFMSIRADESRHRDINHLVADSVHDPDAKDPFLAEPLKRLQTPASAGAGASASTSASASLSSSRPTEGKTKAL